MAGETKLPAYTVTRIEEVDPVVVYRGPARGWRRAVADVVVTAVATSGHGHTVEYVVPLNVAPKVGATVYVEVHEEVPF